MSSPTPNLAEILEGSPLLTPPARWMYVERLNPDGTGKVQGFWAWNLDPGHLSRDQEENPDLWQRRHPYWTLPDRSIAYQLASFLTHRVAIDAGTPQLVWGQPEGLREQLLPFLREAVEILRNYTREFHRTARRSPTRHILADELAQTVAYAEEALQRFQDTGSTEPLPSGYPPAEPMRPRNQEHPEQLLATEVEPETLEISTAPVSRAIVEAIFSGGPNFKWPVDPRGLPYYRHRGSGGWIEVFFDHEPGPDEVVAALCREAVEQLSAETADVFLILLSRISELTDPARDTAFIDFREISKFLGVDKRHGSYSRLYRDLLEEIRRIADLRLSMVWKSYDKDGELRFGRELPDRVFEIVDIDYRQGRGKAKQVLRGVAYRCGLALSHFMRAQGDGLRWIGYCARALFELNPKHDEWAKKAGVYWTLTGTVQDKKGQELHTSPRTLLAFMGKEIDPNHAGDTVDKLKDAHRRLYELGIFDEDPSQQFEPADPLRRPGYIAEWLDTAIQPKMTKGLLVAKRARERARLPSPRRIRATRSHRRTDTHQQTLPELLPEAREIQRDPTVIRRFRVEYGWKQDVLAKHLNISRRTLMRYENLQREVPLEVAAQVAELWRQEAEPESVT